LQLELKEGLPLVEADATQLQQVVMNLVLNASEALGEREGVITITTRALELESAYLRGTFLAPELTAGQYVCLAVSDNGCGMGPETQARIFDPFFSTKFTGRGLGLSAVLGIVRGHEGAIQVQSELGRGTTFELFFPVSNALAEESVRPEPVLERRGTVLVVDDE